MPVPKISWLRLSVAQVKLSKLIPLYRIDANALEHCCAGKGLHNSNSAEHKPAKTNRDCIMIESEEAVR